MDAEDGVAHIHRNFSSAGGGCRSGERSPSTAFFLLHTHRDHRSNPEDPSSRDTISCRLSPRQWPLDSGRRKGITSRQCDEASHSLEDNGEEAARWWRRPQSVKLSRVAAISTVWGGSGLSELPDAGSLARYGFAWPTISTGATSTREGEERYLPRYFARRRGRAPVREGPASAKGLDRPLPYDLSCGGLRNAKHSFEQRGSFRVGALPTAARELDLCPPNGAFCELSVPRICTRWTSSALPTNTTKTVFGC